MSNAKYWKYIFPFQCLTIIFYFINKERFIVWSQIELTIFQVLNAPFQAHSIRTFLVGGVIYLGELLGYNRIITFNFFLTSLLIIHIKILAQIVERYSKSKFLLFIILFFSLLIPFFQNGRGVITSFGLSLLFYSVVILPNNSGSNIKIIIYLFLSFLLLNAASGAFLGAIISIFLFFIFLKNNNFLFNKKYYYLITLFIISTPISIIYLIKNINYFDGSVIIMLNHGAGKAFNYLDFELLFPLLVVFLILMIGFVVAYYKSSYLNDFYPFFFGSIIGLLFGFSSFFTFIYVNMIFILLAINVLSPNKSRIVKL